ncbi:MAG: TetR/AcrR family transcriptional regulator [Hyphomicrobium sp.]
MPKLKPDTQRARKEHILDSAERCFARSGFHATSMHDICREGSISPGALYVYFPSKEALIEGICERDRNEFQKRFSNLAEAPDFFTALGILAESYFLHDPRDRSILCMEIGLESTRNPRVGKIHQSVDNYVRLSFESLFQTMIDEGRIFPQHDAATLARILVLLGDGMFWRKGVDPKFQTKATLKSVIEVIRQLLNPFQHSAQNKKIRPIMETRRP